MYTAYALGIPVPQSMRLKDCHNGLPKMQAGKVVMFAQGHKKMSVCPEARSVVVNSSMMKFEALLSSAVKL